MDGISLMPALTGHFTGAQSIAVFRRLAFRRKLCLWVEHRPSDGRQLLTIVSSPNDELYDLDADDATNLILSPDHKAVRECMSRKLAMRCDAIRDGSVTGPSFASNITLCCQRRQGYGTFTKPD